jgi:hypothetical protein
LREVLGEMDQIFGKQLNVCCMLAWFFYLAAVKTAALFAAAEVGTDVFRAV